MDNSVKEYRELAATFRGVADAADKVADIVENGESTPGELEEATKNFMWEIVKMRAIGG